MVDRDGRCFTRCACSVYIYCVHVFKFYTLSLLPQEIKQIGGRAGRYASQFSVGEVITYQESDMTYLRKAINAGDVHIKKAGSCIIYFYRARVFR